MSYSDLSDDEQYEVLERSTEHALANPMPDDLRRQVEDAIEPHTINAGIKHGEVMECIRVAYPLIRDRLLGGEEQ